MHYEHSIGSDDVKEFGTFSGDLSEQDTPEPQTVSGELLPQDLPTQELDLQAIRQAVNESATPSQPESQEPIRTAADWTRQRKQTATDARRRARAAQSDDEFYEDFSVFDDQNR